MRASEFQSAAENFRGDGTSLMDGQSRPFADYLKNRLEFETLISDTSASLFAAPPEHLDRAVERTLERIRGFFQVDRCALLSVSVDESLYSPNARFLEDCINAGVAANPAVRHVILECPAVNAIDASALESLEAINDRLKDGGITFHLSEVKGPVHLSQYDAVSSINPDWRAERSRHPETADPLRQRAKQSTGNRPGGAQRERTTHATSSSSHDDDRSHPDLSRRRGCDRAG
jgi:hypothetical protein